MIIDINENNFDKYVSEGLKVIVFSASWCSYCNKQNEVFKELPNIQFGKIDGDKSHNLLAKYGIMGFPSFIIFKDGKELIKFSGYKNKFELMNILTRYL